MFTAEFALLKRDCEITGVSKTRQNNNNNNNNNNQHFVGVCVCNVKSKLYR